MILFLYYMVSRASVFFVVSGLVSSLFLFSGAQIAFAQSATIADEGCKEFEGACQYQTRCDKNQPPSKKNIGIIGKKCMDPRGVQGTCVSYGVCKATTATGADGKSMNIGDLSKLMGVLGQVMQALGQGMSGGGAGSGGSGTGYPSGGYSGCTQYYQVNTPSSDPCAYYVPSASSNINIDTGTGASGNINIDTGSSGGNSSVDPISNLINGGATGGSGGGSNVTIPTSSPSTSGSISSSTASSSRSITTDGATGELRVLPNGATIIVRTQAPGSNSVVAGFLGTQTTRGTQSTGIVAGWCRSRPWSTNFLSRIIPATFFDKLCTLSGYQVGMAPATVQTQVVQQNSGVIRVNTNPQTPTTTRATNVPQSPPMTVDIWAVPASVPLGARTTIFWNSKNAQSCTETSPDGSFSHATLSGGGATVPLSGPTTFTISCLAPDGTHATDYVTVNLSI